MVILLSLFKWDAVGSLVGLIFCLWIFIPSIICLIKEVPLSSIRHYVNGFWIFLFSEVMLFACFFTSGLWFEDEYSLRVSSFFELPLLGCFILIGSSIFVTGYHYYMGLGMGRVLLLVGIIMGWCFILLQNYEFYHSVSSMVSNPYDSSSLITVGLHFSHVLVGVVMLIIVYGLYEDGFLNYYKELSVWYWHFVDYVWLVVCVVYYW